MADEKLNTGPGEEKLPEASAPVTADGPQAPAPEQAAAPTLQQEEPAQPEPGDVVVSFDKINELMGEKRQAARAEVEKAEAGKEPEAKTRRNLPGDDQPKKQPGVAVRPKRKKRPSLTRRRQNPARAVHPRRIRRPPTRLSRLNETNCPEVMAVKAPDVAKAPPVNAALSRSSRLPSPPPRPVPLTRESWSI